MIGLKKVNEEVLYAVDPIVQIGKKDIANLVTIAIRNPRKRVRICAHRVIGDKLHEMLIVHAKGTYVPPHKHPGKSESFHVIEGLVDVVIFNDSGKIRNIISMGAYQSGRKFYYRLSEPWHHTLLIRSEVLVFHEITNGPFDRGDVVFAPWSPDPSDNIAVNAFMKKLHGDAATFKRKHKSRA